MNKKISVFLCMGAMLALPAGALAGSISGRVTEWTGLAPLAGIVVESINVTAGVAGPSATTDATGMYALTVSAGTWRVRFRDPNGVYMPEVYNNVAGGDYGLGADIMVVSAESVVTGKDASLAEFPTIFGRVTGPQGQPLQGVLVTISSRPDEHSIMWIPTNTFRPDSNGVYTSAGLNPGIYRMYFGSTGNELISEIYEDVLVVFFFEDPGLHYDVIGARDIVLSAGDHVNIDASLATWSTIHGTVWKQDGTTPLAGIEVTAFETSNWSIASSSTSDSNGVYTLGELFPGTYRVRFADTNGTYEAEMYDDVQIFDPQNGGAYITVPESGSVSNIDARLELPASSISGTVSGPYGISPLAGIVVETYNVTEQSPGPSALTDVNGNYSVGGLSPRIYHMRFRDTNEVYIGEVYDNVVGDDFNLGTDLSPPANIGMLGINASLATWSTIHGTVWGPDGTTPLAGIEVTAFETSNWSIASSSTSDSNGGYTLGGLFSGTYRVRFADTNGTYVAEMYDDVQEFDPQNGGAYITVPESGFALNIDARLARAASSISGTVRAVLANSPLAGILVETYNVTERSPGPTALTDVNGNYSVGGLSPRIYHMRFRDTNGVYIGEVYDNVFGGNFDLGTDFSQKANMGMLGIDASLEKRPAVIGGLPQEDGGSYHILFTGPPNNHYALQEAASLTSQWIDVDAFYPDPSGTGVFSRTKSGPQAFWRVRMLVP